MASGASGSAFVCVERHTLGSREVRASKGFQGFQGGKLHHSLSSKFQIEGVQDHLRIFNGCTMLV